MEFYLLDFVQPLCRGCLNGQYCSHYNKDILFSSTVQRAWTKDIGLALQSYYKHCGCPNGLSFQKRGKLSGLSFVKKSPAIPFLVEKVEEVCISFD